MKHIFAFRLLFISTLFLNSCDLLTGYGEKLEFGAGEIYYKDGATKDEAEKLGNYLLAEGFFDEENPKSIQLIKREDTYVFRMVTDEAFINDSDFDRTISFAAMDFSADVFSDAKVDVELTDNLFKTKKTVFSPGTRVDYNQCAVYRFSAVDETTENKVSEYLQRIGFIGTQPMTLVYNKEGGTFIYEMVTKIDAEYDVEVLEANKAIAGLISKEVLDGKPIQLHFLTMDFTVKTSYSFGEIQQSLNSLNDKEPL